MANINKIEFETLTNSNNEDSFNILNYSTNLNKQINYISDKIKGAEIKITALKSKEKIIDDMITRTNMLVEKYNEDRNYKLAGINSSVILTQFETLSQVQEMLIKYEDMIQKYIKMSIDIENHKINAFVKLKANKKAEEQTDNGYEKLMTAFHNMPKQENPAMLESVREQLKLEGY